MTQTERCICWLIVLAAFVAILGLAERVGG